MGGDEEDEEDYDKNKALSQANTCSNGEFPLNIECQNLGSQIQGDEHAVSIFPEWDYH